ncbi:hypothetical protein [Actinokineospora enzanensis]|uniref:hypothetical protein n=1 Tax=Actinokineospora enzanensis TaxID=155975 RepID=UPI0003A6D00F|nr:hypothetical protein [Actinokineospora enzanensis]
MNQPGYNVPDPPPAPPPGLENFGNSIVSWMKWGGMLAIFVGLIMCAIMMAVGRRNRSEMAAQGMIGVPWVIAGALIIAGGAGIVTGLLGG